MKVAVDLSPAALLACFAPGEWLAVRHVCDRVGLVRTRDHVVRPGLEQLAREGRLKRLAVRRYCRRYVAYALPGIRIAPPWAALVSEVIEAARVPFTKEAR